MLGKAWELWEVPHLLQTYRVTLSSCTCHLGGRLDIADYRPLAIEDTHGHRQSYMHALYGIHTRFLEGLLGFWKSYWGP